MKMKLFVKNLVAILLLCAPLVAAEAAQVQEKVGVTSWFSKFLEKLPGVYTRKELTFFSHFAKKLSRFPQLGRLNCNYNDKKRSKHCPPVTPSPFVGGGGPPTKKELAVNCLHTPEHKECRALQSLNNAATENGGLPIIGNGEDCHRFSAE
jgi:hypothetical protein